MANYTGNLSFHKVLILSSNFHEQNPLIQLDRQIKAIVEIPVKYSIFGRVKEEHY